MSGAPARRMQSNRAKFYCHRVSRLSQGIFGAGKEISQQSLSAFELELKVNTTGTFLLNKHCVRVLQKQNADGVPVPTGGYSIV